MVRWLSTYSLAERTDQQTAASDRALEQAGTATGAVDLEHVAALETASEDAIARTQIPATHLPQTDLAQATIDRINRILRGGN